MIAELRAEFNRKFSQSKFEAFKQALDLECGCPVDFRIAETPVFIPKDFAARAGKLAEQLLQYAASSELQNGAVEAIPIEYNIPNENAHPNFAAVDFAITGTADAPDIKLIELQGFPSLYYFQAAYSQLARDHYDLPRSLTGSLYHTDTYDEYFASLKEIILAGEAPRHVVLLELDPYEQKTACDFLLTEKALGLHICNIRDLLQEDDRLYYRLGDELVQIRRIYNRAIYDELKAKNIVLPVDLTQPLDVTWAGHPNWYYRISKNLLPKLSKRFDVVPRGYLLNELPFDPASLDLEQYVLKPLFSFAGKGVVVGPALSDVRGVPEDQLDKWILQERVQYANAITTPDGQPVKAEMRVMLLWPDGAASPKAAHTLIRLTRGKMVGVDFNKGLDWVGSSCGLIG